MGVATTIGGGDISPVESEAGGGRGGGAFAPLDALRWERGEGMEETSAAGGTGAEGGDWRRVLGDSGGICCFSPIDVALGGSFGDLPTSPPPLLSDLPKDTDGGPSSRGGPFSDWCREMEDSAPLEGSRGNVPFTPDSSLAGSGLVLRESSLGGREGSGLLPASSLAGSDGRCLPLVGSSLEGREGGRSLTLVSSLAGSDGSCLALLGSSLDGSAGTGVSLVALGRGREGLVSSLGGRDGRVLSLTDSDGLLPPSQPICFWAAICSFPFNAFLVTDCMTSSGGWSSSVVVVVVGGTCGSGLLFMVRLWGRVKHFLSSPEDMRGRSHTVTSVRGLW